jgi:23S rRNA pseudouridine1911/1915/1917 synthase
VSLNQGYVYKDRVRPADAGTSVLDYHVARFGHSDVELWRGSIANGSVRVNGARTSAETRLATGDELEFHRAPWHEPASPLFFDVLLEDEHLLAVCKPSGLQVIPAGPFLDHTLWSLVRKSAADRAECSPIHRLGRGTSGIVLFGKTTAARASLSAQFRGCTPCKTYLAIAAGSALPHSSIARHPIGSVPHGPMRLHVAREGGKASTTRLRVLARARSAEDGGTQRALVAAQPITGRPDQIRIHLAASGAPLAGDPLFGAGGVAKSDARPGEGGYLLHATGLSFEHPSSGARIKLRSRPAWLERETEDMQGARSRPSA